MNKFEPSLDIQDYTLSELLELFDISDTKISVDDIKKAKKRVLMLHPDKSHKDPKYFLFFKKAFDIVLEFYNNQHKIDQPTTSTEYTLPETNQNTNVIKQVNNDLSHSEFNAKFNRLFEQHGLTETPDTSQNDWFTHEEGPSVFKTERVTKSDDIGDTFGKMKQTMELTNYNGVQNMKMGLGCSLYKQDPNQYASSGSSSSLPYDDLRRVYRDQSILPVHETDFKNVKTYASVDDYKRDQKSHSYKPLSESASQKILNTREKTLHDHYVQQEYAAKLEDKKTEKRNQEFMSAFSLLK